jgi:DUF4097 and DUF4098 domain-containing protein YvlB
MSRSSGIGFGAFLIGLGAGWYIFRVIELTSSTLAVLLIVLGAVIIVSTFFKNRVREIDLGGITGGLIGGLILSLILTSSFGSIIEVFNFDSSGTYRAQETETFQDVTASDIISVEIDNFNGPITVSTWNKDEYSFNLNIKAKRESYLDDLDIEFDVMETGTTQVISLGYNIPQTSKSRYSIGVEVFLPEDATINLDIGSSNGGISLTGINGDRAKLTTTNGALILDDVYFNSINGDTSNGQIQGVLESKSASLSTSNGAVDLKLPCIVSGDYEIETSNAKINLEVSSSNDVGYDLSLSTSNTNINIDLPDIVYSTNQRNLAVAETDDFSSKDIQIKIEARTSNGTIEVVT